MSDLVWRRRAPRIFSTPPSASSSDIELGAEWTVLPGSRCGLKAAYLLIGPSGIFVVNTAIRANKKVWVDEQIVWVNGRPTKHVGSVRMDAAEASTRLSVITGEPVTVTPVIIVQTPATLDFGGDPERRTAAVVAQRFTQWLVESPNLQSASLHNYGIGNSNDGTGIGLTREAVTYFTMVAEDPDTWC